jgi:hypothetical protein
MTFKEIFEKAKEHPEYWKEGCELLADDLQAANAKIKGLEGDVLMLEAGLLSSKSYAKGMEEDKERLEAVIEVLAEHGGR